MLKKVVILLSVFMLFAEIVSAEGIDVYAERESVHYMPNIISQNTDDNLSTNSYQIDAGALTLCAYPDIESPPDSDLHIYSENELPLNVYVRDRDMAKASTETEKTEFSGEYNGEALQLHIE